MLAKGLSRDFKLQSEILIDLLHTEGIGVRAYSSPNLPFFNKLSASEGKMIVEYIKDYTSLPPHEIHEVASLEQLSRIVDIEWIIPLTKNNTLSGIMVLSRVVTPPERKIYH